MAHKTKLLAIILGVSAGVLALANNAVAQGGYETEDEDESDSATESEDEDDAPPPRASRSKFAGPRNVPDSSGDSVRWWKKEAPFRSHAVTANALSLLLLRTSVNFEILPAVHHSIIVNPSFMHWPKDMFGSSSSSLTIAGIEVGYRFYSGKKGPNGFFIGPSFLYNYVHTPDSNYVDNYDDYHGYSEDETVHVMGLAIDLGGQHVFDDGFTIGGGFGVAYVKISDADDEVPDGVITGAFPRLLFTVGYSF